MPENRRPQDGAWGYAWVNLVSKGWVVRRLERQNSGLADLPNGQPPRDWRTLDELTHLCGFSSPHSVAQASAMGIGLEFVGNNNAAPSAMLPLAQFVERLAHSLARGGPSDCA